jgi:DNA ligase-1
MITRPLLASAVKDVDALKFPVYCTPKYDGIRCLKVDGHVVTRNFKPQPNRYIRELLDKWLPDGVDGELVLAGSEPFNNVQSEVMRHDGEPNFEYHVFDYVKDSLDKPYIERMEDLRELHFKKIKGICKDTFQPIDKFVKIILPVEINTKDELMEYESECLAKGFEGVILRNGTGKYKCGRSSVREGILLKLKRFRDAEAEIIGFEEKMHNDNIKEKNELGLSKRSSHKDGMRPADTLGAIIVRDLETEIEFNIGTGFDDELRKEIWSHQKKYLGQLVKYKTQDSGKKEKPRFPVFIGFRSREDM